MKLLSCFGNLEHFGRQPLNGEYVTGEAALLERDGISAVSLRLQCREYPYNYCRMLCRDRGAEAVLDVGEVRQFLGQYCVSPFWAQPAWKGKDEKQEQQYLLLQRERDYLFVLPLVSERFVTTVALEAHTVRIFVNLPCAGIRHIDGTLAVLAAAEDPFEAVRKGFRAAYDRGLMKTPPKLEKAYPEVLNRLGWCTWDAFYHDVSEEKLFAKLAEFREKQVPVKWVLIDDGWSRFADLKLLSIYEDREKFPNGLKGAIARMKSEYGIEKVGVWHSLTGYWFGAAESFADCPVMDTPQGRRIPGGYAFYSQWHRYLREQGVDFIKVDCQGNAGEFLKNDPGAFARVSAIMDGLERSAAENFDFMINCMGMNSLNAQQHSSSVLLRNSDDFFPNKPESFREHAVNNIYNAVFTDELFCCDYDMWWSDHPDAERSAALRFLSGGPVYVSDPPGRTSRQPMAPWLKEDGSFRRPLQALKPTYDCLFGFGKLLKAFTKTETGYAVAVFAFAEGGNTVLSVSDFGEQGRWRANALGSPESFLLGPGAPAAVSVRPGEVRVFLLEAVQE